MRPRNAITHYCGIALLMLIVIVGFLIHETLTYEGNDIAQAAVLIGGPISMGTLLIGVLSGIALGKQIAKTEQLENDNRD